MQAASQRQDGEDDLTIAPLGLIMDIAHSCSMKEGASGFTYTPTMFGSLISVCIQHDLSTVVCSLHFAHAALHSTTLLWSINWIFW